LDDLVTIKALRHNHRRAIGAVLRGDKEVVAKQTDALVRIGVATQTGNIVEIKPEVARAYLALYKWSRAATNRVERRTHRKPPAPRLRQSPPPASRAGLRVIVHRIT
jgi:hypothetical protein